MEPEGCSGGPSSEYKGDLGDLGVSGVTAVSGCKDCAKALVYGLYCDWTSSSVSSLESRGDMSAAGGPVTNDSALMGSSCVGGYSSPLILPTECSLGVCDILIKIIKL